MWRLVLYVCSIPLLHGMRSASSDPASRQPTSNDYSSGETCGFALHVLIVLTAVTLAVHQLLPTTNTWIHVFIGDEPNLNELSTLIPGQAVGMSALKILMGALLATPVVYFAINNQSVPSFDSLDSLCDDYTRKNVDVSGNAGMSSREWTAPAIADVDVGDVNDRVWRHLQ